MKQSVHSHQKCAFLSPYENLPRASCWLKHASHMGRTGPRISANTLLENFISEHALLTRQPQHDSTLSTFPHHLLKIAAGTLQG